MRLLREVIKDLPSPQPLFESPYRFLLIARIHNPDGNRGRDIRVRQAARDALRIDETAICRVHQNKKVGLFASRQKSHGSHQPAFIGEFWGDLQKGKPTVVATVGVGAAHNGDEFRRGVGEVISFLVNRIRRVLGIKSVDGGFYGFSHRGHFSPPSRHDRPLDGGKPQTSKKTDDGNHHQKLDQSKTAFRFSLWKLIPKEYISFHELFITSDSSWKQNQKAIFLYSD